MQTTGKQYFKEKSQNSLRKWQDQIYVMIKAFKNSADNLAQLA
jgi:hypothetical protein